MRALMAAPEWERKLTEAREKREQVLARKAAHPPAWDLSEQSSITPWKRSFWEACDHPIAQIAPNGANDQWLRSRMDENQWQSNLAA